MAARGLRLCAGDPLHADGFTQIIGAIIYLAIARSQRTPSGAKAPRLARATLDAILLIRLDIGDLAKRLLKFFSRGPFRALLDVILGHERRNLFSECQSNELIDRNILSFGKAADSFVQRFWKSDTDCAHGNSPISRKNFRGVTIRMPSFSAPTKWRRLKVTIALQWPAIASSNTMSSFGSGKKGRHR